MKSFSTPLTPSPLPATTLQNVRRCETCVSKIIPNVLKISPRFAHFWAASPEPSPQQQLQPSGLEDSFVAPPHLPAAHRRPCGPHGGGRGTQLGKRTGTPRRRSGRPGRRVTRRLCPSGMPRSAQPGHLLGGLQLPLARVSRDAERASAQAQATPRSPLGPL